jgi:hypothetical protein
MVPGSRSLLCNDAQDEQAEHRWQRARVTTAQPDEEVAK